MEKKRYREECKARIVLMDFDGTIIDTMNLYATHAATLISKATGMSLEEARRFYLSTAGRSFRDQLRLAGVAEENIEEIARRFESFKTKLLEKIKLSPNVIEKINSLRKQGLKVYLSTNNECIVVSRMKELYNAFDGVLCYDKEHGLWKGEPHLRFLLEKENTSIEDVVFIGDSDYDLDLYSSLGVKVLRTRGLWREDDDTIDRLLECIKANKV